MNAFVKAVVFLTVCCLSLCATFPLPAAAFTISGLNPCTVVAVQMLDSVDSGTARPGDFFRFETVNAVTVGNNIVIPARTMGYGIVAIASPAGSGGRPGTLVLEPRYFVLPGGNHLGVVLDHNASDLHRAGSTGNMPGYLGAVPVPGLGAAIGIFNFFHHGKNIEVKKGTTFAIFPNDSPSSEKCQNDPDL
ncbi:MAG TPA: hypothetical protein VFH72_04485 [Candidatus Baltobacteraceae bacterium]|jgi:hypothetical protein|nr:hypothetical protein [Candidatus Baltobacteraceae bacterium]